MNYKDNDLVITLVKKGSIAIGTIGTVICCFNNPREAYEIEFYSNDDKSFATEIYLPTEIMAK